MDWGFALCAKRSDFALFANTFGFGFCGGWGIPIVIFAVGENTVGRDFALCAKHVGGQRWKVFLIPAPITLTTSVNQQLTLTWLTVKGTNGSTVLSTFKSFYKPRRSF